MDASAQVGIRLTASAVALSGHALALALNRCRTSGQKGSIGRDGSLMVPRPEPSENKCQYDLYPQLLK